MPSGQTWSVIRQVPGTGEGPDGKVARGVNITYQLQDGTMNELFVPYGIYNVNGVKEQLQAHAATTAGVQALQGNV